MHPSFIVPVTPRGAEGIHTVPSTDPVLSGNIHLMLHVETNQTMVTDVYLNIQKDVRAACQCF